MYSPSATSFSQIPIQPPINSVKPSAYAEPVDSQQDNNPVPMSHRTLSERLHDKMGNDAGVAFSRILSLGGHKALEQAAEEIFQDNTVHFLG